MVKKIVNLIFIAGLSAGCHDPQSPADKMLLSASSPHIVTKPVLRRHVAGISIEDRKIEYLVIGSGRDVVLILASIHGNENQGTPLVWQLAEYLQENPHLLIGRKVVLVPDANPDGVVHNTRYNVRGVDLNRNFAADNRCNSPQFGNTAFSEPEARAVGRLIRQYSPNRIVSLHQPIPYGPKKGLPSKNRLGLIDYDGPAAKALAERIARYCRLNVKKMDTFPGSLGSYAGLTLRIPTITFEQPVHKEQPTSQRIWQRYGPALIAAVLYPQLPE